MCMVNTQRTLLEETVDFKVALLVKLCLLIINAHGCMDELRYPDNQLKILLVKEKGIIDIFAVVVGNY